MSAESTHRDAPYAGRHFTRKEVLQLIEVSSDGADLREADLSNLDLSYVDLSESDLRGANFHSTNLASAILRKTWFGNTQLRGVAMENADLSEARLSYTDLRDAILWRANLKDSNLGNAKLQRAHLEGAELERANLQWAKLSEARLYGAHISYETNLANVDWGDYILGEERAGEFSEAEQVYRMLKEWHRQHGHYDVASEFAYRENEARRKARWRRVKQLWHELWQPAETSAG